MIVQKIKFLETTACWNKRLEGLQSRHGDLTFATTLGTPLSIWFFVSYDRFGVTCCLRGVGNQSPGRREEIVQGVQSSNKNISESPFVQFSSFARGQCLLCALLCAVHLHRILALHHAICCFPPIHWEMVFFCNIQMCAPRIRWTYKPSKSHHKVGKPKGIWLVFVPKSFEDGPRNRWIIRDIDGTS